MISLAGNHVLVIGGSGGIGLATARLATELGAHVTIASRSADRVASAVAGMGRDVRARVVDVTSDESVQSLFADNIPRPLLKTAASSSSSPVTLGM